MKSNLATLSRIQKLAWTQIALIALQFVAGVWVLLSSSNPDPEVDSSVNTYGQIAGLIFGVFLIPAIPVVLSAFVFIKPTSQLTQQQIKGAFVTQTFVFAFCVFTVLPALQLAFNGFWVFFADCSFGFLSWFVLRSELKSKENK